MHETRSTTTELASICTHTAREGLLTCKSLLDLLFPIYPSNLVVIFPLVFLYFWHHFCSGPLDSF
ncbi:hypothetical protein E2C01_074797 [Portunus trituberculatus]|uniref:Uncharacterized protein n=1 Tax=Portunus trituberculatus TaxID=210409 RepID=A0A5B7ID63_PORTR|nr:hypothetical protein [Portunus trituberculatus]